MLRVRSLVSGSVAAVVLAGTVGCQVTLISSYDAVIDEGTTKLHTTVEQLFGGVERKGGSPKEDFGTYAALYEEISASAVALEVRAKAGGAKNEKPYEQVKLLRESLGKVETAHKEHGLTPSKVSLLRKMLEPHFTAIVTLQKALRRGEPE
ncbi:MAG: hypothetical protein ACYTKD_15370 [Planctomycetota bacterium]|jgi:hypothetical protein